MRFSLTIELGNDAMRTGEDVARALESVAYHARGEDEAANLGRAQIRDDNGNLVGTWSVEG